MLALPVQETMVKYGDAFCLEQFGLNIFHENIWQGINVTSTI
jgi:hypothetical protein